MTILCPSCQQPMKAAGKGIAPFPWAQREYTFTRWTCSCGGIRLNIVDSEDSAKPETPDSEPSRERTAPTAKSDWELIHGERNE